MAAAQALLEVDDVTKSFGAVAAGQGVSSRCTRARPLTPGAGLASSQITSKDGQITSKDGQITSKDGQITSKEGQITGKEGEKVMAGKLDYTVGANGEIVLGPPTEFTAQHIDQFNF